jgi:hypothetical protein
LLTFLVSRAYKNCLTSLVLFSSSVVSSVSTPCPDALSTIYVVANPQIITDYSYKVMKQNSIAIATVLAATMLTAIFATTTLAYADESETETETEQELKQKNVGSGESFNDNCGANFIDIFDNLVACSGELP